MSQEYRIFSSYRGLDRVAMYLGIPLLWAIFLLTLSVICMFTGMAFFGMFGLVFLLLPLPFGFMLNRICETDDKALDMMMLELRYRSKRVAYEEFGNTLTYQPERYLRYENVNEQYFEPVKEI